MACDTGHGYSDAFPYAKAVPRPKHMECIEFFLSLPGRGGKGFRIGGQELPCRGRIAQTASVVAIANMPRFPAGMMRIAHALAALGGQGKNIRNGEAARPMQIILGYFRSHAIEIANLTNIMVKLIEFVAV